MLLKLKVGASGHCLPPHHHAGEPRLLCLSPDLGFHTAEKKEERVDMGQTGGRQALLASVPRRGAAGGQNSMRPGLALSQPPVPRGPALG